MKKIISITAFSLLSLLSACFIASGANKGTLPDNSYLSSLPPAYLPATGPLLFNYGQAEGEKEPVFENRELLRTRTVSFDDRTDALKGSEKESAYIQFLDDLKPQATGDAITYSGIYRVPFKWVDRRYFLRIEGADGPIRVMANGQYCGSSMDAASGAEFDITALSHEGVNEIEIAVESSQAAFSNGKQNGGIGRVLIISQPRVRIRDYVSNVTLNGADALVELGIVVKSHMLNTKDVRVHYQLQDAYGTQVATGYRDAQFDMKSEDTVRFLATVPAARLWSPESPYPYTLLVSLQQQGRYTEHVPYRLGLKTVEFDSAGLLVNGNPATSYVTEFGWTDRNGTISAIREALSRGFNTVRPSGPQPDEFYRMCDSMGMWVINSSGINTSAGGQSRKVGGNPTNDPRYAPYFIDRNLSAYYSTRNHPSVLMFSLAENSSNGFNLYESYLAVKGIEKNRPVIYTDGAGEWNTDAYLASSDDGAISSKQFPLFTKAPGHPIMRASDTPEITETAPGQYSLRNRTRFTTYQGVLDYQVKQGSKIVDSGQREITLRPGEKYDLVIGDQISGKRLKYTVKWVPAGM